MDGYIIVRLLVIIIGILYIGGSHRALFLFNNDFRWRIGNLRDQEQLLLEHLENENDNDDDDDDDDDLLDDSTIHRN